MNLRKQYAGFTLIELMVVVAIVAVLALVALPAYQSHVISANRAMAKSYLLDAAQMQHLYFNDTRTYAANAAELNSDIPARVAETYLVTFSVATILPPQFIINAIPLSGTIQAGDGTLYIDNTGAKEHGGKPW